MDLPCSSGRCAKRSSSEPPSGRQAAAGGRLRPDERAGPVRLDPASLLQVTDKGLEAIDRLAAAWRFTRSSPRPGRGYYFLPTDSPADDYKLSPDGHWALIQIDQKLYLVGVAGAPGEAVDLNRPATPHATISSVGADFFAWADGGRSVTWAIGSTFYRQPLDRIALDPAGSPAAPGVRPHAGVAGVEAFDVAVTVPRDVPRGVQEAMRGHGDHRTWRRSDRQRRHRHRR